MSSSSGRDRMYAKACLPALDVDLELKLRDLLGVDADRVAARAEAAVDRAGVERQEQRAVEVAVGQPRDRHVGALVERIEIQLGVIRQVARRDRDELQAQRILVGPRPVDERQQVGRHANRHRRVLKSLRGVLR